MSGKKAYECYFCPHQCYSFDAFFTHLKVHERQKNPDQFRCGECRYIVGPTSRGLKMHQERCHHKYDNRGAISSHRAASENREVKSVVGDKRGRVELIAPIHQDPTVRKRFHSDYHHNKRSNSQPPPRPATATSAKPAPKPATSTKPAPKPATSKVVDDLASDNDDDKRMRAAHRAQSRASAKKKKAYAGRSNNRYRPYSARKPVTSPGNHGNPISGSGSSVQCNFRGVASTATIPTVSPWALDRTTFALHVRSQVIGEEIVQDMHPQTANKVHDAGNRKFEFVIICWIFIYIYISHYMAMLIAMNRFGFFYFNILLMNFVYSQRYNS